MSQKVYSQKSVYLLLFGMIVFFYVLNYLTPMAFGDDYLYSFIWQGLSEYEPLTDEAIRVNSFHDLFVSQYSHYLTWSGRTVNHTLMQLFLWVGKGVFNFCNAMIAVILILTIYWCAHKGEVSLPNKPGLVCFIFFALWSFTPGYSPVFFWLAGACNYLWTATFLLLFLLPYVRKYYSFQARVSTNMFFPCVIFFCGLLTGWTNENSICWVIIVLMFFIISKRRDKGFELWMLTGVMGLALGYALLMLAPGNVARLYAEVGQTNHWLNLQLIKRNLGMILIIFVWQFFLWYFNIHSLRNSVLKQKELEKDRLLVKILCALSLCMSAMMIVSPNFPPRSSFPGTVMLVIASCLLLRLQASNAIKLISQNIRKGLLVLGMSYFTITATTTVYGFYDYYLQIQHMLHNIQNPVYQQKDIITVNPLVPVNDTIAMLSGYHLLFYVMSEDENDWRNVAVSRYYGIKGIRIIKKDIKK